ncbi:MAG: copper chaperone PCu(A)C [Thiohalocapsa sp.]
MSRIASKTAIVLACGLLAAALPSTGGFAQTKPVAIENAWARATPAKAENGAAYLTLRAADANRLTGISTPVAKKAELHQMKMEGSVMKMRQVAGIDLPPGKAVTLKPGGFHIMLVGLNQRLQPGQSIPLTLHFAKGGDEQVTAPVEAVGAMGPHQAPNQANGTGGPAPMPAHH